MHDYTNIASIKDFAVNTLIPKYFDSNVTKSNVGLLGYTTEFISTGLEDAFTTLSFLISESFPTKSVLPETIYSNAALYHFKDIFATPAYISSLVLFIKTSDIKNNAEYNEDSNKYDFFIDRDTTFNIDSRIFSMDYDLKVSYRNFNGEDIYQCEYVIDFTNSISKIYLPYVKSKLTRINKEEFLMVQIELHQVIKSIQEETLTNNDMLNSPRLTFTAGGEIANFEVFYKDPTSGETRQLEKVLYGGAPIDVDFCYFRLVSENEVELSFSNNSEFFIPQFNSDLTIEIYTTDGKTANFDKYEGVNINITAKSEKYFYNTSVLKLIGICNSPSTNGADKITLTKLSKKVNELRTTLGTITNEKGLELHFDNFENPYGNKFRFIKTRNDAIMKLFSVYTLFKKSDGGIYQTNTLNIKINESQMDSVGDNNWVIKPGRLFTYDGDSKDTVISINRFVDNTIDSEIAHYSHVYCSPYMINLSKNPQTCNFYLNTVDKAIKLEYDVANDETPVQFICNSLRISRFAVMRENSYTFKVYMTPTSNSVSVITTSDEGIIEETGDVKIKLFLKDTDGEYAGYIDLAFNSFDVESGMYEYIGKVTTDDYIKGDLVRLLSIKNMEGGNLENILLPMSECDIELAVFHRDESPIDHNFSNISDVNGYSLTNTYVTNDQKCCFIQPVKMFNTNMSFIEDTRSSSGYNIKLSLIPLASLNIFKDSTYMEYVENLSRQYEYINSSLNTVEMGYSVALKAYNTYGRSNNFICGDDGETIDSVNCGLEFKIKCFPGINTIDLVSQLKIFIKEYIENINSTTGANSVYISDIISGIKNNYGTQVKYIKFISINDYDASVQSIESNITDFDSLEKSERMAYVPEYMTVDLENIKITII